jgi:hypothetical protein
MADHAKIDIKRKPYTEFTNEERSGLRDAMWKLVDGLGMTKSALPLDPKAEKLFRALKRAHDKFIEHMDQTHPWD